MNLAEIITNVNAELGPATNIDALIRKWANRGQQKFLSSANHDFSWSILNGLTLTTEAEIEEYALSPLVDTSKAITMYSVERRWRIKVISRREFQTRFPDTTLISGDPVIAYLSGYTPFNKQPSSASVLTLVSSDSNDDAVVTIDGLDSNGVLAREEITLTGNVPVDSTTSFTRVLGRSINGYLAGILTITSNAGAVTNEVVSPRERQGLRPKITFYPTPSEAKAIYYDAVMKFPQLVTDNDMSLIPEQFHDAIEDYCLYRGYRHKKDKNTAESCYMLFKERVAEAVRDDRGPSREVIVNGGKGFNYLGDGSLPGLFPAK